MYQSIRNENGSYIYVFDLNNIIDGYANPLDTLKKMMVCIEIIEEMHPNTFRYRFNGTSIEVLSLIPSHKPELTSLFGRYGGALKFYLVLTNYLVCLLNSNLRLNKSPPTHIPETLISTGGSVRKDGYRATFIETTFTELDIIRVSKAPYNRPLIELDMKYWIKQINPDCLDYRKKPVIENPKEPNFNNYPPCILYIMKLKDKPRRIRYLLMKYLLFIHKREDAKMVLQCCLNEDERRNLDFGGLDEQWTNAVNCMDYNMEPTCEQLRKLGVCPGCKKISPFEETIVEQNIYS